MNNKTLEMTIFLVEYLFLLKGIKLDRVQQLMFLTTIFQSTIVPCKFSR
jgi:hypothetical protein